MLPFTETDAVSRYPLICPDVEHPDFETVWPIPANALKEYGLPRGIRSGPSGAQAGLGLGHYGAVTGAASIIRPASASPPAAFSSPSRREFPLQHTIEPGAATRSAFTELSTAKLRLVGQSATSPPIASPRRSLTIALTNRVQRCPCRKGAPSRIQHQPNS
ncbi:hypothetical protein [Inquilinus limosus]|uniref:hypothetical protein n=1 Tax=Inquilinus limosus TaxID=171674 RepID=UPI003F5CCE11